MSPTQTTGRGAALRLADLRFGYEATDMHFDFSVQAGEIVALMGPSGSGKTTVLNLIAGFETPHEGAVLIDGVDMSAQQPSERPVSMVFQENNLFGHLDVAANVGLGRSPSLKLRETDRREIAGAIERVGLAGKEARMPAELSGGERQRVALARVLVRNRPVLLLDEPFAGLGPSLRAAMLELIRDLHAATGMTILLVTHDPDDALAIAGRLVFLEAGHVEAMVSIDDLRAGKAPPAVRAYLGLRPAAAGDLPGKGHDLPSQDRE